MNIRSACKKTGLPLLIAGSLMLLPSCAFLDWLKEKFGGETQQPIDQMPPAGLEPQRLSYAKTDDSPVLATVNGKPLITKNMLEAEKKKLIESNPQLQAMIALMDEKQFDRNLVDGMVSREVIRKYVSDNKIDGSEKYKKDFEMVMNQVRDALNTRYFMEAFPVSVSDNEVKKFYDDNKETIPNLLVSSGGVESKGISFTDAAQANEFAAKVRANKNDITRAAKEAGLTTRLKDFKLVNSQSIGIEPALRDKIVEIKSTPSVHTFNIAKEHWVIAASKVEKPQYREFDQVKDDLRQLLEKDKTMKQFEEQVVRLRDQYRMELNEDLLNTKIDNAQAVQADASIEQSDVAPVKVPTAIV